MVSLATLADYVTMLIISGVFGSVGGLGYELLQTRQVTGTAVAAQGGASDTTTDAFEIPHRISRTLYEVGVWGSLIIGGIAAVAALYFFPPQLTIQVTGADGVARTVTQYDLIKLVALSLIVGSAGPSFLTAMQARVKVALSEQRAATTQKLSEQQLHELKGEAAAEVRTAMAAALNARGPALTDSIRTAAEADHRDADRTTPAATEEIQQLFHSASEDAAARLETALDTRIAEAKRTLALV